MDIILNNRYKLIERIGGGGMADVYRAKDERLGRDVAVKILKDQFADDEDFVSGFRKESYSAAKLNHQNIVGVYDVGSDTVDGVTKYYIVMELVNGKTLKDKIREKDHLSVDESVEYTITIAEALLDAHKNGIIHRDVKPQNILLHENSIPKVADFGIAQGVSQSTLTTNEDVLGSVHYFSPEQASGKKTDERSDIYSLGIVLYEMVTGELPFNGETPISVALKHIQEDMPSASLKNPQVPSNLDSIIKKMTAKNPEERYNNLKEVISSLKNIDSSDNISDTLIMPGKLPEERSTTRQKRVRRSSNSTDRRPRTYKKTTYDEPSKGKSILSILLGILLAAVLTTSVFFFVSNIISGNKIEEVTIPNLLGLDLDEARDKLEELNLNIEVVDTLINDEYEEDQIISQDPIEGTKVKEDYTVKVIINASEGNIEVKNYIGYDFEGIENIVESEGLTLGEPKYEGVDDEEDEGKIISQDLRPGLKVEKNSKIIFTVGEEKEVEYTEVPNLMGEDISNVKSILENSELKLGSVEERESDRFSPGTVIEQSIDSGEEVEVDTEINVVIVIEDEIIDEEPDEEDLDIEDAEDDDYDDTTDDSAVTVPLTFNTESTGDIDLHLRIDKIEDGMTTTVYDQIHESNTGRVTVDVEYEDGQTYIMYVNDREVGIIP